MQSEIEPDGQRAGNLGVGRDALRRVALRERGIVAEVVGWRLGARAERGVVRTDDGECVGAIERDLECAMRPPREPADGALVALGQRNEKAMRK